MVSFARMRKPFRLGWTLYVVIALAVLLTLNAIINSFAGYSFLGQRLPFFLWVAFATLLIKLIATPLTRRLIWRVRNRLLLTYFLIGIVPVTLLLIITILGGSILLGTT